MGKHKQIDMIPFRHLYPFASHFMERNGLNYHYIDEGTGDPIVMLHGNPTWSFYYRNLIKGLSPFYRTIAPDHIGCGLSDKPGIDKYDYRYQSRVEDLEALIDHLHIENRITLVLHDWGGMIGLAFALRNPRKVSRIIITNTTGFFTPGGKRLPFRLWLIRHISPFATIGVLGFNLFSIAALYMCPYKPLAKDVKKGLTAPYDSWKNRIATLKFVQDIPVKPTDPSYSLGHYVDTNLHKLSDIPMLILWGKHDFVFTVQFLDEWQLRFPDAEAHLFPDAGHYLFEDVPEKTMPLIKNFLGKYPV